MIEAWGLREVYRGDRGASKAMTGTTRALLLQHLTG
jgi:hypothetical protein